MEFIKVTSYTGEQLRRVYNVTYIKEPENTYDLSDRIAQWILNDNPNSGIIGIDLPETLFSKYHVNLDLIHTIIRITGYPVLYIPECTVFRPLKNILFPLSGIFTEANEFQKFFPLMKSFNSNVYLLNVPMSGKENTSRIRDEWIKEQVQLLSENNIVVKSICIDHKNVAETILAYASIIQADLIFNSLNISDMSLQTQNNKTWQMLIRQSKVPLFNYLN